MSTESNQQTTTTLHAKKEKKWFPLESNPTVMNKFIHKLGIPETWGYHDIFGFDDELLAMIPQPVLAVLMLFPITDKTEELRLKEQEQVKANGQIVNPDLYFMKQTISNACGTIGILHAAANNRDKIGLADNSFFKRFFDKTKGLTPEQRAEALEQEDEIEMAHDESSREGQTQLPGSEEEVNLHFVAFVEHGGYLYELDGRRETPINRGKSSPDTLLKDAINVIKMYMALNPNELNFTAVALAPNFD